jgi:hypothetical protein
MPTIAEAIRAAVEWRFDQVAHSPEQERRFPVGPASAKKIGYDPQEIDAPPGSVTESFCGVGSPLDLGRLAFGLPRVHITDDYGPAGGGLLGFGLLFLAV